MTDRIRATYENGVFKPLKPVQLPEGTQVFFTIESDALPKCPSPDESRRAIMEIASLPPDGPEPDDGLSGSRDHDKILYGGPKGAL